MGNHASTALTFCSVMLVFGLVRALSLKRSNLISSAYPPAGRPIIIYWRLFFSARTVSGEHHGNRTRQSCHQSSFDVQIFSIRTRVLEQPHVLANLDSQEFRVLHLLSSRLDDCRLEFL